MHRRRSAAEAGASAVWRWTALRAHSKDWLASPCPPFRVPTHGKSDLHRTPATRLFQRLGRSTTRVTRIRLILAAAVLAVLATTMTVLRQTAKPVFLETTTARYRVISARYMSGTNLTLARDQPIKGWYRRQRTKMGRPLPGIGSPWTFHDGVMRHAIVVLCEGQFNPNEGRQMIEQINAQCIDAAGGTISFNRITCVPRNDDRFWLVWEYTDPEITNLHRNGLADFEVTNFCPRQLRLVRKSDHHELTRLELSY